MTDFAAQFVADAGISPVASSVHADIAPTGLAAQFLADVSAAPAAPPAAAAAPTRSIGAELARQVGLTARAGVTGITALPAMLGDALNAGYNHLVADPVNTLYAKAVGPNLTGAVTGQQPTLLPHLQPVSQAVQGIENAVGLPQPRNATERVVQDAASAMAGVAPSVAAGRLLMGAASPAAQAVGAGLQAIPGMQIAGAAGAGLGAGTARELGLPTPVQIGAGLLGTGAGLAAASGATAALRAAGARMIPPAPISAAAAEARADAGIERAMNEMGPTARQSYGPIDAGAAPEPGAPPQLPNASSQFGNFQPLRRQVTQAIQENPQVDPAAAMRASDFQNLGIEPTLGQITRDPTQYARELNIRGTATGAPIANRLNQQNMQLQQALYGLAGTPADAYSAGSAIRSSLQSIDNQMSQQVSDAYAAARASSGKNLDVPLAGVAQDYATTLKNFGDKVPSGVRNNFNELGLLNGTQRKVFTIDDAENLLKVINSNASNDPATNTALAQLRTSVKNAILSADDQGGVYAPARQLAAQRFALQDQIPALEAAAADRVPADDFVRRFIVGGKTDDVVALTNLLREHAPAALDQARSQIGAQLVSKGFGANPAGDARFNPSPYMQQIQAFGPTKLGAFFSPDEINQLNTIGRVGSYMNAFPAASPVNTSNTASALGSLVGSGLRHLPYVGGLIDNAQNRMFVNRALAARLSDAVPAAGNAAQQRAAGALLLNAAPRAPRGNP
ncbi:conserved hypothetical protein [Burkholderia cepacia]|uniref:hypothetical protein n=1 Tax=Burkholderia cepacia TaxID=292 RepID=UPI0039A4F653